jgi:hypothetical protein
VLHAAGELADKLLWRLLTDEDQPGSQPPQQQAEAEDDRSWRNWIRSDDAVTIGVALAVSYGIRVCASCSFDGVPCRTAVTAELAARCSCRHRVAASS